MASDTGDLVGGIFGFSLLVLSFVFWPATMLQIVSILLGFLVIGFVVMIVVRGLTGGR